MLAAMTVSFLAMYLFGAGHTIRFAVFLGLIGFMLFGPDSLLSGVGAIDVGSQRGALAAAGIINGMGAAGPIFQEEIIGRLYKAHNNEIGAILGLFVFAALTATALTFWLWRSSIKGRSKF